MVVTVVAMVHGQVGQGVAERVGRGVGQGMFHLVGQG